MTRRGFEAGRFLSELSLGATFSHLSFADWLTGCPVNASTKARSGQSLSLCIQQLHSLVALQRFFLSLLLDLQC